jgi:RHS repeat-associated protein
VRGARASLVLAGVLAASWRSTPLPASAQQVRYYHLDALGSTRVLTDAGGTVVERHDYLAFGEECTSGTCAFNPGLGAGAPRKFTGKERDVETGLDYFGARYLAAPLARFTSHDPVMNGARSRTEPLGWNRYAYALNNPLRNLDPDGKEPVRNQLGSAASVGRVLARAGVTRLTPELAQANHNPFRGVPGRRGGPGASDRYVAAERVMGGFIDMQHFLAGAAKAHEIGYGPIGVAVASWGGFGLEFDQARRGHSEDNPGLLKSAFSFEDVPSNDAGAVFGGYYYDENQPLGPQVEAFLRERARAITPQELKTKYAERYKRLPASEKAAQAEYDKQ